MEWIFSGYCRAQDQARTVMVELEDGQWDICCSFPECAYANDCAVGKQIREVQEG